MVFVCYKWISYRLIHVSRSTSLLSGAPTTRVKWCTVDKQFIRTILGDYYGLAEFFDAVQCSIDSLGIDGVFKLGNYLTYKGKSADRQSMMLEAKYLS